MVSVGTVNIKSVNCAHFPRLPTLGGVGSYPDAFSGPRAGFKRKDFLLFFWIFKTRKTLEPSTSMPETTANKIIRKNCYKQDNKRCRGIQR